MMYGHHNQTFASCQPMFVLLTGHYAPLWADLYICSMSAVDLSLIFNDVTIKGSDFGWEETGFAIAPAA